jgi:dUTP pyrophosphatase
MYKINYHDMNSLNVSSLALNTLPVELLSDTAIIPKRGSERAAGYDLYPVESGVVPAWGSTTVNTGIKITMPLGYYGRIASRSGLAVKHNIEVGAGVIDNDYTGEIIVLLRNFSDTNYNYPYGKAIAQLILTPYHSSSNFVASTINRTTERGDNKFGSTDIR